MTHLVLKVRRPSGWQSFEVRRAGLTTVGDALRAINREPRALNGELVEPVTWTSGCTWPACGSCVILIDGRAAPACMAPLPKRSRLRLEPLAGFGVVTDLLVDRARLRDGVAAMSGWIDRRDEAAAPATMPLVTLPFSACTDCGACLDACPEAGVGRSFVGPHAILRAHEAALHEAALHETAQHEAGVPEGGTDETERPWSAVVDCGLALACEAACPQQIPLAEALLDAHRRARRGWLGRLFGAKAKTGE